MESVPEITQAVIDMIFLLGVINSGSGKAWKFPLLAFLTLVLVKISFISSQVIDQEVESDLTKGLSVG